MRGSIVMERKGQESIAYPDMKHYGNESTWCYADWVTFDLELARSNCFSGMGGPIVIAQKGRKSLMWNTKEMSQLDAALTGIHLTLTLTVDLDF